LINATVLQVISSNANELLIRDEFAQMDGFNSTTLQSSAKRRSMLLSEKFVEEYLEKVNPVIFV